MLRYLVVLTREPEFQSAMIEPHNAFLDELRQRGKLEMNGPFTNQTGGAYILQNVENLEEAKAIAFADPLHLTGSSIVVVHEWNTK